MAIDKSIFDSYQKSLLNKKYVDFSNPENIVYIDEKEAVAPMTADEYAEMEGSIGSSLAETQEFETSSGLIEKIFSSSSQTFTSFTASLNSMMSTYASGNNTDLDFINPSSLSFVENAIVSSIGNIDPADAVLGGIFNTLSDVVALIPSITSILLTAATAVVEIGGGILNGAVGVVTGAAKAVGGFAKNLWNGVTGKGFGDIFGDVVDDAKSGYKDGSDFMSSITTPVTTLLNSVIGQGRVAITNYSNWLSSALSLMSDTFTNVYSDGVSETSFGQKMELSWRTFITNNNNKNIVFTKLNIGTDPIIFGAPPRYNTLSDPRDRSYMNTFIKDGNILSIIPGKPKYNGLSLGKVNTEKRKDVNIFGKSMSSVLNSADALAGKFFGDGYDSSILNDLTASETGYQTTAQQYAEIALDYLKRNGISEVFNANDKRYYTFEQDYENYYSYLETMLNTIYTRMGLGENEETKSELFSFFSLSQDGSQETLLEKFNGRALGFYFEGNPAVSENLSNDTNDPANLKSTADSMSDEFQRINYVTGFGVKAARKAGIASARITRGTQAIGDILKGASSERPFSTLASSLGSGGSLISGLAGFGDKLMGALSYTSNTDLNAITESMLSTNGMKTVFPNLWTDSNYSKSINVEFEFISPYGDPLSIFQYVYLPLCSILALALPKQAEENGYVNPFFLRLDIPGVISSDFAIISNITWVRGGANNLWTVDRHPRAVTVSVTFEDLFQFLSMTKRISYLSANPNYSMFLDSFSGIRTLHNGGNSVNSDYWNLLVNRLNSSNSLSNTLWNQTEVDKTINRYLSESISSDQQFFNNYYKRDISWMKSKV